MPAPNSSQQALTFWAADKSPADCPPALGWPADPRRAPQSDICRFKQEAEAAEDILFVPASE